MVFYVDHGAQRAVRARTDFFLVNVPTFDANAGLAIPNIRLDTRLAELTSFFTVFSFNVPLGDIRYTSSIQDALEKGTKDFCLIQNAGHIFYGGDELSEALVASLDACEFLTGHIMDRGGYFYLHDQCLLVNRRAWEKLGKPPLGLPEKNRKLVPLPERSPGNVHDNYTPLWLKPTGRDLPIEAAYGYNWHAIAMSLKAGIEVTNWPEAMRRFKRHCYAYYGDLPEWQEALVDVTRAKPTEDTMLRMVLDFLQKTPNHFEAPNWVFVFNSEADLDVPILRYRKGLDTAFMLASGFKTNRILETLGFHDQTHVVVYDYSRPALALRLLMVAEWDGKDFAGFLAAAKPRIDAECGKSVYIPEAITGDVAATAQEFTREMRTVFRSMDHWLAHWNRYRQLPHTYVQVDVLRQQGMMEEMLKTHGHGHTAIWMSDMFNSPNAVGKFSYDRRRAAYDVITRTLGAQADSYLIIGNEPRLWLAG
jgi:hypothetical protein